MPEPVSEAASVLVVDDNPLIVNILRSLLGAADYQVFTSTNGEEAFSMLAKKAVDVIICDVMMPQMDGYELHKRVREASEFAHIPFIFLSALGDSVEVSKGKEAGADDYLVKPFDPKDLLSVVKGKVARSRHLRSMAEERYDAYRKKVVHTLSHEFRTPLVAINTGTELLLEQHGKLDVTRAQNLLEAIRRGGQRLERLVNDFMILQQIEAGVAKRMFEARKAECMIDRIVESVVDARVEALGLDPAAIEKKFPMRDRKITAYEPHLRDILTRLIDNAVKFSDRKDPIEVCLSQRDREYAVEIRDRGIGMDIARVAEAIDVFGQIDRDRLEQQGGGLGLAIANRFAVINGGRLEFQNRDGGGTVVALILPMHGE